jgi:hypothetical protein
MTRQEREGREEGAIGAQKGEYVGKVLAPLPAMLLKQKG